MDIQYGEAPSIHSSILSFIHRAGGSSSSPDPCSIHAGNGAHVTGETAIPDGKQSSPQLQKKLARGRPDLAVQRPGSNKRPACQGERWRVGHQRKGRAERNLFATLRTRGTAITENAR
jgi:hypothetical protein